MTDYVSLARADAQKYGIDADLFVAQIQAESGFQEHAVSPAGAHGIAQFMPATASALGVNPDDPVSSLDGAARLMASYYTRYGSYDKALAAYNAGQGTVDAALNYGSGWMNQLPIETQRYIVTVLNGKGSVPQGTGNATLSLMAADSKNTAANLLNWIGSPVRIVKIVVGIALVVSGLLIAINETGIPSEVASYAALFV